MIGRLAGKILSKTPPQILIDVNGVGYEVEAPMTTFYELPDVGENAVLLTHMVVREDAQLLYGFFSKEERAMFRLLIRINGVGPKLAVVILSGIAGAELARCVSEADVGALVKLPGVGKKTAERLIIELKDRLKDMPNQVVASSGGHVASASHVNPKGEAVGALIALGYKPQEAERMVKVVEVEGLKSEELIRLALKAVATKK